MYIKRINLTILITIVSLFVSVFQIQVSQASDLPDLKIERAYFSPRDPYQGEYGTQDIIFEISNIGNTAVIWDQSGSASISLTYTVYDDTEKKLYGGIMGLSSSLQPGEKYSSDKIYPNKKGYPTTYNTPQVKIEASFTTKLSELSTANNTYSTIIQLEKDPNSTPPETPKAIPVELSAPEDDTQTIFEITNGPLYKKVQAKIILKVENKGEAYYVHPSSEKMYYLGRPSDAFEVMRSQGIGISNKDLGKIDTDQSFAKKHLGKIFLQIESKGEAWYINPSDAKRYYLGRPQDAFDVMRKLGLGISNKDFDKLTK